MRTKLVLNLFQYINFKSFNRWYSRSITRLYTEHPLEGERKHSPPSFTVLNVNIFSQITESSRYYNTYALIY